MDYLKSSFFKYQIYIQVLLIALAFALPDDKITSTFNIIAIIFLVLVGIPHGANDLLYRSNKTFFGATFFLVLYLGSMAIYGLIWWRIPQLALLIFLFISVHHFGQSNFESTQTFHLSSILWGSWILLAPVCVHIEESLHIFSEMTGTHYTLFENKLFWLIMRYSILATYLFVSIIRYKQAWKEIIIQAVLIALWIEVTDLLSGFIIVFSLWHSSQSLQFQWKYYQSKEKHIFPLKVFIMNMILFTCISFLALYLINIYIPLNISTLFILLSLITLPHVVVMDGIYKKE